MLETVSELGDNCIVFENFTASIGWSQIEFTENYSIVQSQTRNIKQLH